MFHYLLSACIFLTFSTGAFAFPFNDQDGKINQKDANGLKQGRWVYFGKDMPAEGIPAEGKVEEGPYKDDRKEGTWIKYHNDGVTPRLRGEYSFGRPKGKYIKIYANGIPKEIGTFDKNQYKDSLLRNYENGVPEYIGFYNGAGKEQGVIKHYHPNGKVAFVYNASNGVLTGKATRYWPNGDIKEEIIYGPTGEIEKSVPVPMKNPEVIAADPKLKDSKPAPKVGDGKVLSGKFNPNAYNKVYNSEGEISQDGDFKDGKLWDGKVYVYDKDGILLKVQIFKNGKYHSDGQL
jgi:antitoxin component YwqK of YwqJK toxin-antitoxin module